MRVNADHHGEIKKEFSRQKRKEINNEKKRRSEEKKILEMHSTYFFDQRERDSKIFRAASGRWWQAGSRRVTFNLKGLFEKENRD
jgi:hypothetical protein